MPIPIEAIRDAAARTGPHLHRTPLLTSRTLGERAQVRLALKTECFQKTGSFKPRGALNVTRGLDPGRLARGLVPVSAGNHAQAVAWAAARAGVPCTVVMPATAPRSKQDAVRGYGGVIISHPDLATLFDRMREEQERSGAEFVHPFDDPAGLAGAGTVALEILEQAPEVDRVVVPVGGGGLLAGVACAIKALKPACRVIGVELAAGAAMTPALAAGKPVPVTRPRTRADGLAAPFVGALALEAARRHVDAIAQVDEAEIEEAMRALMLRAKLYVEGAGAAATAAVLAGKAGAAPGESVVAIVSGGNVDPESAFEVFGGAAGPVRA